MAPLGDMFQRKKDKQFQGLPDMFGIAGDILIAGFNDMGRDHDATLDTLLRICRHTNVKLYKDKCLFMCTSIPFFDEIISMSGVSPDPRNVETLMAMTLPKWKKEFQSFLGILNYLSKFSPMTAEVSEPLWKLTSVKTERSRNGMYQGLYDKTKYLFRQYICMKFYGALKPLNLETDSVNLGAGMLQVRGGMNCW